MADGFLGRWSQRKQAVREGKALDEPAIAAPVAIQDPNARALTSQANPPLPDATEAAKRRDERAPLLTLEDVQRLTAESNYAPFVARDVAPEIRNAAMKKLFTDPHYNVMDRLDIYIDDYAKPSPLPESMLRQMASAKFLKLFEEEEKDEAGLPKNKPQPAVHTPVEQAVEAATPPRIASLPLAQSPPIDAAPLIENPSQEHRPDHDHTDLRLQPNHAAEPPKSGRSTE